MPGAGMMPKLMAGLMILFGIVLPSRALESQPFAEIDWSDLTHALLLVVITAAAAALYQRLGFLRDDVAPGVRSAHRGRAPQPAYAAAYASVSRCSPIGCSGRRSRRRSNAASLVLAMDDPRLALARLLGSAAAGRAVVRVPRLHRRHAGRRAARHRPARRHLHPAAAHLRARRHQRDRDARRHLLRLAIRRLDHLDPAAHPGRSRLGDDLHRRQRDGAQGPGRRRALHRGGRLVHRRDIRRDRADGDRAAARGLRAALRPARIHRAAGARPRLPRLHVDHLAGAHVADGGVRPAARHHRHRRDDRALPFLIRYPRARRRHRHRAGRGRAVRPRRNPRDDEPAGDRRSHPPEAARALAEPAGVARVRRWPIARGSVLGFFIGIIPGSAHIISSFLSYAVEKKISKHPEEFGKGAVAGVAGPNRRTTPPRPAPSCRCSRSAFRPARSPRC